MEFSFEAKVVLTLEHELGKQSSKHVATDFNLEVDPKLDRTQYLDNDVPTKEGAKILSNVLVQGLIGNIHSAHQLGFRDSAEHLRWIIEELTRGFATVANVDKSTF